MTASKIVLNAASGVGSGEVTADDVFSTYLYTGTYPSSQTITNNIDLAGKGGLVWFKARSSVSGEDHVLADTERGVQRRLSTNLTTGSATDTNTLTAFNSDGFTIGNDTKINDNSSFEYASWTFRKHPRFFDIVTYSGDGTTNRQIPHNLEVPVGHITVKKISNGAEWFNWHRTFADNELVAFSGTYAAGTYSNYLITADSETFTVGNNVDVNGTGEEYIAYLWAHDPADGFADDVQEYYANGSNINGFNGTGEYRIYTNSTNNNTAYNAGNSQAVISGVDNFSGIVAKIETDTGQKVRVGPQQAVSGSVTFYSIITQNEPAETSETGLIACGSYLGGGSSPVEVNLGFEPQFIIQKDADSSGDNWRMHDVMRGWDNNSRELLNPNGTADESSVSNTGGYRLIPTATGFYSTGHTDGNRHIYIAIRRGPMTVPTDASEVFDVGDASETGSSAPEYQSGFTVDMALKRIQSASQSNYIFDRLRGGRSIIINGTAAESAFGAAKFDYMDGYYNGTSSSSTNWSAMWKRAPNFFDTVCYNGTSSALNVTHNLGVVPEMIWTRRRDGGSQVAVYHKGLNGGVTPEVARIHLSQSNPAFGSTGSPEYAYWNETAPTETQFTVNNSNNTNGAGQTYVAHLFASLDGISKVGSYTGSASAQTIDCGFTAGAKFVLIKRTDSTGSWVVWDTNRGIVAGNDPYFKLETNAAPTTTDDIIDPHNSGFTLAGGVGFTNTSGGSYIFYAVA